MILMQGAFVLAFLVEYITLESDNSLLCIALYNIW